MYETLVKTKRVMNYVLSRLCTVLLVSMTLLVLWQVFTRYALNSPASFTEELVRYFLIWTGFIGAAYAFSTREHMALTFIRDRFEPNLRRRITVVVDVIILLFALFVMLIGGVKLAFSAQMEYSALLGVSRALVYSVAPLSGFFIVIIQLMNIYEDVTGRSLSPEILSEEEAAIAAAKEYEKEAEAEVGSEVVTNAQAHLKSNEASDSNLVSETAIDASSATEAKVLNGNPASFNAATRE